ncbi:hypothetical protein KEM56_006152 [Ascosphaera pollenicola]|nr:hypothetical protein KEM56_006152 [Ascosphaera pollenicola]
MEYAASALRAYCEMHGVVERITWSNVGDLLDRLSDTSVNTVINMALVLIERVMAAEALDCSDLNKFSRAVKAKRITTADLRLFLIAVIDEKDVGSIQQIISDLRPTTPSVVLSRALLAFDTTERCKPGSNPPSRTLAQLLNRYVQDYKTGKYASPYTSVVGPSGIGKSASVKNMAMSNIQYVCYVSLASESSSAVPRRSHAAAEIARFPHVAAEILRFDQAAARNIPQDKRAILCRKWSGFIMAAAIDVQACRRSGLSPAAYFKIQTGDFNIYYANSLIEFGGELEGEVDRQNTYEHLIEKYVTGRQKVLAKCLPEDCTPVVPEYESIIICLDEARALLHDDNSPQFRCSGKQFGI